MYLNNDMINQGMCKWHRHKVIQQIEQVYVTFLGSHVPKNNPDWRATTTFAVDNIVELAGTIIKLEDNFITVRSHKPLRKQ